MTPNEKARELVGKFRDYVHGYVGSSMLTNYEYPEQILSQAKKVAIITCDEVISQVDVFPIVIKYWNEVKDEINKL